ncbi:COG2206 c-di-GMP phosphodiesterase class II (HD-GYP domain) [Comamonadaceae bacterium]
MWKKLGVPVPIDASQVVIGLYVWLDLTWDEHPFFSSRFMVKTAKDVSIIQSLDIEGKLYFYSEQSTAQPGPLIPKPLNVDEVKAAEERAAKDALVAEMLALEKAKMAKQKALRDAALRADQAWGNAARAAKAALNELPRSPKVAGKQLVDLSSEAAAMVSKNREVLLHLLGDKKEQGPQFHALNCMTLAMLVGKKAGMNERGLADLALAALAHDAGESQIPQQILKNPQRKKHEEDFFRQHVTFSTKFAEESGAFSPDALAMISDHHEAMDGSGWPRSKQGDALSVGARILAIVDRYDTLCTPDMPKGVPMMPAEALATMFRNESTRLDKALLSLMIKLLGVYPPGTAVQLSDGSLALVIAPGANSLKPTVLLYSPELSKDDAPTIDLAGESDIKIVEAVRPSTLPLDVFQWLNPQQRLSYFFSVDDTKN